MPALGQRRILIVDDNVAIHDDFYKILRPRPKASAFDAIEKELFESPAEPEEVHTDVPYVLDSAYQGQEALALVKKSIEEKNPYALAFIDVRMPPGWNGIETIQRLWAVDPNIQMVICTAFSDYSWDQVTAVLKETDKFLILKKPFDVIEIRQLASALTQKWVLEKQLNYQVEHLEELVKERTNELEQLLSTTQGALEDRMKLQQGLTHQATHDVLTGLPNRMLLFDRIQQAISGAKRFNTFVGILVFDLDKFKQVNDSLGHHAGDTLLKSIAKKLKNQARESDTIARLGGDEFVMVLPMATSEEDVSKKAAELVELLKETVQIQNQPMTTSTSIGISLYPSDGAEAEVLLKNADIALYKSKKSGGNQFQFYKTELDESIQQRADLMTSLREAVAHNELVLYYQPIVNLKTNLIVGLEALVRWMHPRLGLLMPHQFIPLAEEMGIINSIGEWILRTACEQNKIWSNTVYPDLSVAVNISKHELKQVDFVERVKKILEEAQLEGQCLTLEMTESLVAANIPDTLKKMTALKEMGVHFAIDDFGTGYASLSCIKYFPFDRVKIDKSFIEGIHASSDDNFIIEAIINMAKRMEIKVLGEGIETEEQLEFLKEHGCDEVQGYYLGAPLEKEGCEALLLKQKKQLTSIESTHK